MQACQRFALAACCHADQLTKRGMFFERKKALKRNVATRQPARVVRRGFAEQLRFLACRFKLESWFLQPTKLDVENKTEQNLRRQNQQQKCTFYILQLFCGKKLIVPNLLNSETKPNSTIKSCLLKIGCWQTIENNPSAATSHEILL